MWSLVRWKLVTVRAGKPLWMKRPFQILLALLLAEKLVDGKPNHRRLSEAISWNTPCRTFANRRTNIVQL
jgi:hypothetical protein